MAISFPLTPPTSPGVQTREFQPQTVVGVHRSPFTGAQQVYSWPGQWLQFTATLPPLTQAQAGEWSAFFLSLNGPEGTFYFADSTRKATRGTASGSWQVGAGATANNTTLPLQNGSGVFAVGDWLQVSTGTSSRLHRVLKVNLSGSTMVSVDVFPRLRAAHAQGTAITYANPKGLFRLATLPGDTIGSNHLAEGVTFTAVEAL